MFRIKTWIPIEANAEEDTQYITKEDAENEIAQLGETQPENIYEVVEEHNCAHHIAYSDKYEFIGDAVLFYGKCSVCGKELVHTFYGEKNARERNEGFIHSDTWKQLNANDIISSIDIGLSVLNEKEGFDKEHHGQLLVLIEEIAKMMVRTIPTEEAKA